MTKEDVSLETETWLANSLGHLLDMMSPEQKSLDVLLQIRNGKLLIAGAWHPGAKDGLDPDEVLTGVPRGEYFG